MQPQHSLAATPAASAVVNAIDTHPALSMRGGDSARRLWRVFAERAGYRTGPVVASEAELAQAIGKARKESLWASKGSPGPMDRLLAIGAIVRDGDRQWFYRNPADVDKPKAATPPDPQLPLITDIDDTPPPDTLPIPGVPRDSRNSDGGKGGRCAQTDSIPEQQEQETSNSYSEDRDTRGSPRHWKTVRHRLAALGAYGPSKIVAHIRNVDGRAADLMGLCEYFETNPDGLKINGGALHDACFEWLPGMEYNAPGLWPQVKLPAAANVAKSVLQLADEREHRRTMLIRRLRAEGKNHKAINVTLAAEGLEPVDEATGLGQDVLARFGKK